MEKKLLMVIILSFLFATNSFSQDNETINVRVQASLKRGITVISKTNTLDFGEIVLSNSQMTLNKSPQEGLKFKVISHPEKPVLISYDVLQLSSSGNNHNSSNTVVFIPKVYHTGVNSEFINPIEVTSGVYYQPQNQSGEGILNIWIGGTLQINQESLPGDYTGTFVITIAY